MPSLKYLNLKPRCATEGHINSIPQLSVMKCNMLAQLILFPEYRRKTNHTRDYENTVQLNSNQ